MFHKLDFVLRLYVVLAGLAWALSDCVTFIVDIGRLSSLQDALLSLLSSLAFPSALWLSGFGACRGWLRWLVAVALAPPLGRVVFGFAALADMPFELAIPTLAFLFFAAVLPIGLGVFLLFRRPPSFLLVLERLASRRFSSAPAA